MGDYHEFTDQYKVPVIAKLLHALPHYNITFHKINSTFRPNDEIYLEVREELCIPYRYCNFYSTTNSVE